MSRRFALTVLVLCNLGVADRAKSQPRRAPTLNPAAGDGTLYEEDGPAVTWTGSWSRNTLPANSGGSARLAMDAGAEVRFGFTGTGVSWIGYRDEWSGIARVSVDGEPPASVDTYSTPAKAQATLYTITGLGRGRHTLSIQTTGTRNAASAGSWIWVDAFSVAQPGAIAPSSSFDAVPARSFRASTDRAARASRNERGEAVQRIEQDDAALTWSGAWSTNQLSSHSRGSAKLSMEPSSRVSLVFRGTGVSWIGYQDQWSGIADVLLDGQLRATVDTYSKPARAQAGLYTLDGLADGTHTLVIRPTGRRGQASAGSWIWVDGFSVTR